MYNKKQLKAFFYDNDFAELDLPDLDYFTKYSYFG